MERAWHEAKTDRRGQSSQEKLLRCERLISRCALLGGTHQREGKDKGRDDRGHLSRGAGRDPGSGAGPGQEPRKGEWKRDMRSRRFAGSQVHSLLLEKAGGATS